ncbi:hypothetical protein [Variovorax ginsengisoli]|uniref:Magnesium-transporting ATPase (P-type) n=1 Tax=Variovorax ginsengisoli TaxID=363844 RepID=A0ABT9SCX5_9BURK|nr:hypothetical protein [Variovorax ginsengisoli]MDP9902211.1 magnesium-transporting ATPase (P-type) [Variovorax ginsengisoli]
MIRLIYWVPLIVALGTLFGYFGATLSTTVFLFLLILMFVVFDLVSKAIFFSKQGDDRLIALACGVLIVLSVIAFFVYLIRPGVTYPSKYEGYTLITAFNSFFPLIWISLFSNKRDNDLDRCLKFISVYVFGIDLLISAFQIYYVTFVDPSGGIFSTNQRLNSIEFDGTYRLTGIFQSGQDHGFFLVTCLGLLWAAGYARGIFSVLVAIAVGVCVYYTYTRTIYLIFLLMVSVILVYQIKSMAGKGKLGALLFLLLGALFVIGLFFALDFFYSFNYASNAIFNTQTLDSRQMSWAYYFNAVENNLMSLVFGLLLMQSGFNILEYTPPLIDNFFFASILFAGIPFLVAYLIFYALLFRGYAGGFLKSRDRNVIRFSIFGVVLVVATLIAGYATPIWDNYTNGLFGGLALLVAYKKMRLLRIKPLAAI